MSLRLMITRAERVLSKVLSYRQLVRLSAQLNIPLAPPMVSGVQVTLRCNSRCSYCSLWRIRSDQELPLAGAEHIFRSLHDIGVRVVTLTGGEPLLHSDLPGLVLLSRKHNLLPHVCTNGLTLTRDVAEKLVSAGLSSLILSLDTLDAATYVKHRGVSFEHARQALNVVSATVHRHPALVVAVNCVVTGQNFRELPAFVRGIAAVGKGRILVNFQPYNPPPSAVQMAQMIAGLGNGQPGVEIDEWVNDAPPLTPDRSLSTALTAATDQLLELKKQGYPINVSEVLLRSLPGYMLENRLPGGFRCVAGYTGILIRLDGKVLPCWRLPPAGDLRQGSLRELWFSAEYRTVRRRMKSLDCPGCLLLCHNEPGWFELYNHLHRRLPEPVSTT